MLSFRKCMLFDVPVLFIAPRPSIRHYGISQYADSGHGRPAFASARLVLPRSGVKAGHLDSRCVTELFTSSGMAFLINPKRQKAKHTSRLAAMLEIEFRTLNLRSK